MKKIAYLLIIILLSTLAYAEIKYTEIYDSSVKDSGTIDVDNVQFSVYIVKATSIKKVKVTFPSGQSYLIGGNESVKDGVYILYLDNIRQGSDDEFDIALQEYPYYADIRIEKSEAAVKIERTFEKTEFYVGETISADVEMVNEGSAHVFDASYVEEYPKEVTVEDCVGCTYTEHSILWEGNLNIGKVVRFNYKLKATDNASFRANATLSYNGETIKDSKKIKVKKPKLDITTKFSKTNPDIGEEISINITLTNNDESKIEELKYKVFFPKEIRVTERSAGILNTQDYFVYEGELEKDSGVSLYFKVLPKKSGTHAITETVEYKTSVSEDKMSFEDTIESTLRELNINVVSQEVGLINKKTEVPVKLINPSDIVYKNIDLNLETDLPVKTAGTKITEIQPKDSTNILTLVFTPEKEEYYLNLSLTYETAFGEILKKEQSEILKFGEEEIKKEDEEIINNPIEGSGVPALDAKKPSFINEISGTIVRTAKKPLTIVVVFGIITLAIIIWVIVKRTKQEVAEDLTDSKLK